MYGLGKAHTFSLQLHLFVLSAVRLKTPEYVIEFTLLVFFLRPPAVKSTEKSFTQKSSHQKTICCYNKINAGKKQSSNQPRTPRICKAGERRWSNFISLSSDIHCYKLKCSGPNPLHPYFIQEAIICIGNTPSPSYVWIRDSSTSCL